MTNDGMIDRFCCALFTRIVARPIAVLLLCGALIAVSVGGLSNLTRDPSVDAFIPGDHWSFIASERAKRTFGLSDPIVVALVWKNPRDVFRPQNLQLIHEFQEQLSELPNVAYQGVTSLASESFVDDRGDSVSVMPYVDQSTISEADAQAAFQGWQNMVPHHGTLVSDNAEAAAILIELDDSRLAEETYRQVLEIVEPYQADELSIHVAGLGAVVGYLSETIASDVASLVPLIYVVVLTMIFIAFRSLKALVVPLPVIIGSVTGSLGLMATAGIPYFAITSALPVIVVAISVADTIYILTAYRESGETGSKSIEARAVLAMTAVIKPITLTTLTTSVGFVAIAIASIMPPIVYFAWFAAVGIGFAWLFSVLAVPAMIVLLRLNLQTARGTESLWAYSTVKIVSRPVWSAALVLTLVVVSGFLASKVSVDRSLVESFPHDSSIYRADQALNSRFAGTAFLDVIIDAKEPGGLLNAEHITRIAKLQEYMETLPRLQKTIAVTDYLGQIHRAIEGDTGTHRSIPASDDAIAQYLLLYEASSNPAALKEEIDADYRQALVRGVLNTQYSSEEIAAVEQLQYYVDEQFSDPPSDLQATLSGRVNTRYHWMNRLALTHVIGVALSICSVFLVTALLFRSISTAAVAVAPVIVSVLGLYAVMGSTGIHLEPATSMFAAISIGVGVDYAIHLVYRLRKTLATTPDVGAAATYAMHTTGRACFFNAAALGLGFLVLTASDLATLTNFGTLIAVAAFTSFLAAFVLIPLLFRLNAVRVLSGNIPKTAVGVVLILVIGASAVPPAIADEAGRALAERIDQRNDGTYVHRRVAMELITKSGSVRQRSAHILRARSESRRSALIVFSAPKSIRETAFLNHDELASDNDSRWLFIPATDRVRRLPVSQRGDYFLGTDFTYADIQSELKFDLADYDFHFLGKIRQGDRDLLLLNGTARSVEISRELGYGEFEAKVDANTLIPVEIRFSDPRGRSLKTISVGKIAKENDIAYASEIDVVNHQSGHRTVFRYEDVRFPDRIDPEFFSSTVLRRGISRRL